jgi:iron complex transport system substrate-binding protein
VRKIERIGDANALNWERLLANRPDVVVAWENLTNTLVIESLRKLKLPVYFVRAKRLADIPASMRRLGVLVGAAAAADAAASDAEKRLAALSRRKSEQAPLKVFYMIWDQPLYTIGGRHIINDAIQYCGAVNIFSDIDFPAPVAEIEAIVKRNPDVIIMSAPPITARDWRERWQRFTTISAVANQQILRYNDPRLDRMGPSAIDAVDGLCKLLAGARKPRA